MPVKLVPPSRNAAAEELIKIFQKTEQKLIAEITRKRAAGYVDYAETAALTRVRKTLQEMLDKSGQYVPLAIEKEFYKGSQKHRAGYENARQIMTPGRTKVVEQLTDNLLGQIREMAGVAYQDTADKLQLLGRISQDPLRTSVLRASAETVALGAGALSGVNQVIAAAQSAGITAFVDKAGRQWSLRAYGNMAVRTTIRQAQVSATLTIEDQDLYKVVRHYAPCAVCAAYSDRVYSKSGKDPNYPALSTIFGKIDPAGPNDISNTFLNIHPNCLCTLVPYTEAGKTKEQVEKMREQSSFQKHPPDIDPRSKKELAAYKAKERARAEFRAGFRQWEQYREALGNEVPATFQTFQKHKKLDDQEYKAWKRVYAEKQRYSGYTKTEYHGIIQTGARIVDPFSPEAEAFAKLYYPEIRKQRTDVKRIAEHTGRSEAEIQRVKNYLFLDNSYFNEDKNIFERFAPDAAIAQSWQRLSLGRDIKPHDRLLIDHELYEMKLKDENPGISHDRAHTLATQKFNYQGATDLYYDSLNAHKTGT